MTELPVVDLSAPTEAAAAIDAACRDAGFFYVVGHGIDPALPNRLEALSREFFALDEEEKAAIAMERAGPAWRGWFPVGGELTSGRPDQKEGIYFGAELGPEHPKVRAGVPLHGANLFPARPVGMREVVLEYMDVLTGLGHTLLSTMALALGLDSDWFRENLTSDPTILFRIFHYPPATSDQGWGVGEHTDYGLLTILLQDANGGLEVRSGARWIEAPPVEGSFVCNLGDMLERMTGGRYRSTPHRVRNTSGNSRLSFPFFFDPSWDALIQPTPNATADPHGRWDGADPHSFEGTYGDYLLGKVAKVFPTLTSRVLDP